MARELLPDELLEVLVLAELVLDMLLVPTADVLVVAVEVPELPVAESPKTIVPVSTKLPWGGVGTVMAPLALPLLLVDVEAVLAAVDVGAQEAAVPEASVVLPAVLVPAEVATLLVASDVVPVLVLLSEPALLAVLVSAPVVLEPLPLDVVAPVLLEAGIVVLVLPVLLPLLLVNESVELAPVLPTPVTLPEILLPAAPAAPWQAASPTETKTAGTIVR